ncbi:DUF924 family protein [Pseudohalioglobus lutimaris]|uniref:DUF924 domain-containing protein n=1 Tax=Pseudohalioglobus lutimaris TaxID=1737061 RepID=A0A2N5X1K2_9GAMM|nr:DUF924 family protein [Pseudohalioglobus lutimaris]PLW68374.1 DUF924 domain-containing protein [Pseudohalioglobus lutimaris]
MAGDIDEVHAFWFGELDAQGMSPQARQALWFRSSAETDELCRSRFGHLVDSAVSGGLGDWEVSDRGLVALVLLLDQLTRNIYRGTPAAYAGDPRALALSQQCIASTRFQRLPPIHQVFILMPLEHSETLAVQEQCVTLFNTLANSTGLAQIAEFHRYAIAHRDVIARFGRFPHRNAILQRTSTAEEVEHLNTHGGF